MTRLIGASRAKELIFTARLLNAKEAHEYGIVNQLSTDTSASSHALQLAEMMASNAPLALRAAKSAIDKSQSMDVENALNWERSCYEKCLTTKDRIEGLRAFAEKRKPVYKGE